MGMNDRKFSPLWIGLIGLVVVLAAVAVGWRLMRGDGSLLRDAAVHDDRITPNADGVSDITGISYTLSDNATVSIYFEDETGKRYYFREDKPRGAGEYAVQFSGVVDGYELSGDEIEGDILSRLLQDGEYVWWITAVSEDGSIESASGLITITDADPELPELRNFTLNKDEFSPNRDGIDDRVQAQFFLPKDVKSVRMYLLTDEDAEIPISELERDVPANSIGRHYFDYEGGVDNGETPPKDGRYPIFAIAEDDEGQKVRVESALTIAYGGVPRADIFSPPTGDTFIVDRTAVVLCDTLYFTMTVQNYGNTPIRTTGPEPGTVYDSDWNYNTLGWHTESGAWRVAVGYENELSNYPYRWAVGNEDSLEKIGAYYYLMPGERALVTGGIRLTNTFGDRNPQPVWAGLIHEDVEISQFNTHVDPKAILVDLPDEGNLEACESRAIPMKGE